ncbi:hypothetical protein [Rubrivirga litoralis]|uniref:Membrane protein YfhO n=1 Tax=Rubrivirga litoralis TaxID=3075598 RepID=A0ABU3BUK8_9BACT|nr:hypothetical protein [Rubrivirga sp. F394]MDT0632974.1 hypothetical protein [Rubrivirga sp. F394]
MAKTQKSRTSRRSNRPAPLEGNDVWRSRSRVRRAGPALREATWWEGLPGAARHGLCLAFLLLVAVGFFWPTTFGGRTLVGGDTVQWRATAEAMLQYEAATGDEANWAPNVFGGMPGTLIIGSPAVPGADSVARVLRRIGLWPVAHFLVLLGGMYALVFYLTRSSLAGVIGAVGYGLSTYLPVILTAGHNSKFVALAYAPWLLLAFGALVRRGPESSKMMSALLVLLFAIAASVNLRAGHVQITYYVVVVAAVWWIAEGVAAVRAGRGGAFAVSTGLLVVGSALGLALVADPYLAQWEYKAFTTRAASPGGGLGWAYAMSWSQGFGELLTLVIPNAYGGGGATYWGGKPFTAGPHYVGTVVALLALVGVAGVARRSVAAFGVATLLTVLFALGENFPALNRFAFEAIPLFNAFRVPETWLAATVLLLALLAGWGAYYLQRREATTEAEDRKRRIVLIVGAGLAVLVGGLWLAGGAGLAFERAGEAAQVQAAAAQQFGLSPGDPQVRAAADQYLSGVEAERAGLFAADAARSLLFLGLALGLVALLLWRRAASWAVLAGLALLVTVDLWGVGRRYFNEDNDALRRRSSVEAVIPETAADQFVVQQVEAAGGAGRFRVLPPNPTQNAVPSYFYESVGGYHGAKLTLIQDYFDRLLPDDETGLNPNALRLLSTRYVVAPGVPPGLDPVFQDPQTGLVVSEDSTALPRAFLADEVRVVPDEDVLVAAIRDPAFDPRETALLAAPPPGGAAAWSGAAPDSGAASVELQRFEPDEIVWRVRTDRPRLLVASEVYYPAGWTVTVGSEPAPILRTDFLLRGVPVPAGEHIVTMRYVPETKRTGRLISWIATLLTYGGVVVVGGLLWYRRGQEPV